MMAFRKSFAMLNGLLVLAAHGQLAEQFSGTPQELYCQSGGEVTVGFRPNGLGEPDDMLVAWQLNSNSALTISSGLSNGTYTAVQTVVLPAIYTATSEPPRFAFSDLDLDGDEDAIVYWNSWQPYSPTQLFVLWWEGANVSLEVIGQPIIMNDILDAFFAELTLFDLNDDGLLDIVLDGQWRFLMGPSSGPLCETLIQTAAHQFVQFTPSMPKTCYGRHHDMDADGKEDLLCYVLPQGLGQFRNLGGDQFVQEVVYSTGSEPGQDEWHDADQNGIADLVRKNYGAFDTARVWVSLVVDGQLQPSAEPLFAVPVAGTQRYARDVDNDGILDLILRTAGDVGSTTFLLGSGSGSWGDSPVMSPLPDLAGQWALLPPHDVDADGDVDIVIKGTGCVAWYENRFGEVGLSEIPSPGGLSLYPNPARDHVEVHGSFDHGTLIIRDVTGRLVIRSEFVQGDQISVQALPSGVYACSLQVAGGRVRYARFVKD